MRYIEIKKLILNSKDYDFLRTNKYLGKNIILLGLGGSYAYGTNIDSSDIDIRGVATNTADNILLRKDFDVFRSDKMDTTIYSLEKIIQLLINCNPNTIELLGLEPDQFFYLSDAGKELIKHKQYFLSKRAINTFGGYANAQLRRLQNLNVKDIEQNLREKHILNTITHADLDIKARYDDMANNELKLYIDKSQKYDMDTEIFINCNIKNYPLRDFSAIISEYNSIIRSYNKIGVRNEKAIKRNKINKHMMHLVRLYLMCFDILERQEIITKRTKDLDFLMAIRNGEYTDSNDIPTEEFYKIVDDFEKKLKESIYKTKLPDNPDFEKINQLVIKINKEIILNS